MEYLTERKDVSAEPSRFISMPKPFLILALPRSRTAWLAHFLSDPPFRCGHDTAIWCNSVQDFLDQYKKGMAGTVETGAMIAWRILRKKVPEMKMVLIRRPIEEIRRSLLNCGFDVTPGYLEERDAMLDVMEKEPGIHSLHFQDLADGDCCGWLYEYCLEMEFDPQRWAQFNVTNIQIDLPAQIKIVQMRQKEIARLKDEIVEMSKNLLEVECPRLN